MSSNTRSTPSATPERRARRRACRAPTTPMPGRPTAMPGCRRRRPASGSCCGSRTAIRSRSRRARSASTRWARSGSSPVAEPIAPFASRAVDVAELLPGLAWPRQIELRAGKHVVRPRYEIVGGGAAASRMSMSSAADLRPDPELPRLGDVLGKGYLLPAPVLPRASVAEPGAADADGGVRRAELPIAALVYDPKDARSRGRRSAGCRATTRPRSPRRGRRREALRRRLRPCRAGLRFRDGGERRRLAACAVPLSPPRQRPCRRDQLRRACLQHDPGLSRRAAILCRPPAGPVDPAVPAARRGRLRHAVPPDLSGVAPVAPGKRDRDHPPRPRRAARSRAPRWRFPVRVAAVALSRRCSTRRPAPAPAAGAYAIDPRPDLPSLRLSRAAGREAAPSASTTCSAFSRLFLVLLRRRCGAKMLYYLSNGLSSTGIARDAGAAPQQGLDHRRGAGRVHRGDLRRARQPAADPGDRASARRPADDHHRCRELPRLCRRHPGPLADGADAGARPSMSAPASSSTRSSRSISRAGRSSRPAIWATSISATR